MSGQKYLFTVAQTAALLSLSRSSIYKLIDEGKLLAVYPNAYKRIPESSISAFVRMLEDRERSDAKALRKQFA